MSDFDGVRMYFGSASGSGHKALRLMEEPHVMLSATTAVNYTWDGIGELFVDSGGYSLMKRTGEHLPTDEYLDVVESKGADLFGVQDYPCEPDILAEYGRSVREHQAMTNERTAEAIVRAEERGMDAQPVAVVQGWERDDYVRHVEQLMDEGLLTDRLGIGSVCRRGQVDEIRGIIRAVDEATPSDTELHAFGVKNTIMSYPETRERLASVDSTAWYQMSHQDKIPSEPSFRTFCDRYISYWRKLANHCTVREPKEGQTQLSGLSSRGGEV